MVNLFFKNRIKKALNAMNNIIIDTNTTEKLIIIGAVHLFERFD
jgi:hypothetical protein